MEDLTAKVAVHEQQIRSLEARVKAIEDLRESIGEIKVAIERQTGNIDRLAAIVESIGERQREHEGRLDAIEQRPAERWETIVKTVVTCIVSALVGAAMAGLIR